MRAGAAALGQDRQAVRPEGPEVAGPAHPLPDLGLEPDRAGPLQQRDAHLHRGDGRGPGPHPVAAHQLARRGDRPADRLLGAHRAQHPALSCRTRPASARSSTRGAARTISSGSPTRSRARAWAHIQEVEGLGGMAKAIETGLPKMRIEEAAARRQARIDSGPGDDRRREPLPAWPRRTPMEILEVDNTAVREAQLERLARAARRARRARSAGGAGRADPGAPQPARATCSRWRSRPRGRAPPSARSPIALEKVFGRHKAVIRSISGVYSAEFGDSEQTSRAVRRPGRRVRRAARAAGRASWSPRWARTATTAAPRWSPPPSPTWASTWTSARSSRRPRRRRAQAVENDVHVVGMSSLAAGHKTLLPQLVEELGKLGREDILVVVGGVIPAQDYDFLREHGAAAIFGPGTVHAGGGREAARRAASAPGRRGSR